MRRQRSTSYESRSEYVYEVLTLLYPPQFRHEYGEEMVRAFGDLCRDRHGYWAFVSLWLWALADLFKGVFIERSRISGLSTSLRLGGILALIGGGMMMFSTLPLLLSITGWLRNDFTEAISAPASVMNTVGRLAIFGLMVGLYLHLRPRLSNRWHHAAFSALEAAPIGSIAATRRWGTGC
jgi:hypothetical protein